MKTTKWFLAPLFAAFALLFAGCSNSDDISGGGSSGGGNGTDGDGNEVTAVGSSREKATLVAVGNSSTHIIRATGEHWFKFEGTGETVIFETAGNEVDTYIDAEYEKTYFYNRSDDNSGEGANALLSVSTVLGETYWVKITARNSTSGTYTFVVTAPTSNGRLNSIPVTAEYSSLHTINSDGTHWFKFEGTGSSVIFETEGNVVNTTMNLFIGTSESAILTDKSKICFYTASGISYYIKITGNSGTYTFSVKNGIGDGSSKNNAIPVTMGNSSSHTITSIGEHWFSFLGTGETTIFETTGNNVDTYIDAEYEKTYFYNRSDDNSGEGYNALLSVNTVLGETYFIKITARNSTTGIYNFVLSAPTSNGRLNSIPVTAGYSSPQVINSDGTHWFSFQGTGSSVIFETEGNVVNTTMNLFVGTSESAVLTNKNLISFGTALGTTYYIKITGNSGTYTFSVKNGTGDGSSKTNAISVAVGNSSTHTITSTGEHWFSFLGTGNAVIFETTGNNVDTYIDAEYEKTYFYNRSDDNSGEEYNALLSVNTVLGETYWIRITAKNNSSGTYGFVVRNPD